MKNDVTSILDQLLQMFRDPDCNVNTMWEFFKQTLSKSAKQHIPQKNSKDRDPWYGFCSEYFSWSVGEYQVKCICKTRWLVY
jgi:hypothetical protein